MSQYVSSFDVMPGVTSPVEALTSDYQTPQEWLFESLGGMASDSGVRVNPKTALSHCPVWQAVNVLAGDMGLLSLDYMRVIGRKKNHAPEHPGDWLLNVEPNQFMSAPLWKETMLAWALTWGNGISAIMQDRSGKPVGLLPLLPDRTSYEKDDQGYFITTWINGKQHALLPNEVIHIRGLATNGFWGLSAVQVCKNTIGHGLAMEKHGNRVFKNGSRPGGAIKHPGKPSPDARKNMRREWEQAHKGVDNAAKIAILWEGADWQDTGMSNQDAEWLGGRKLDREMVASLFNLPAFKLNSLENASVKANVEEQNRGYYTSSLARWAMRFATEGRKLMTPREREQRRLTIRVVTDILTQGNRQSRMNYAKAGTTARLLTRNEGREELGLNPVKDGDVFENPAIDVKKEGGKDNEPNDDTKTRDLVRDLVSDQVAALLSFEQSRLSKVAKRSKLAEWAASFYGIEFHEKAKSFLAGPVAVAASLGIEETWQQAIADYAGRREAEVIDIALSQEPEAATQSIIYLAETMGGLKSELTIQVLGGAKREE